MITLIGLQHASKLIPGHFYADLKQILCFLLLLFFLREALFICLSQYRRQTYKILLK